MELVAAIRHSDFAAVRALVADPTVDVNARLEVPGVRISMYESHALFEAARSGSLEMLRMVLSRPDLDVNQPAASINITALADACNRGAEAVAATLLDDSRVDPFIGSDDMRIALQYACKAGHGRIVELFEKRGLLRFEHEQLLLATAAAEGHQGIVKRVEEHFMSRRTMRELSPRSRVFKLWQEFQRVDEDKSGTLDMAELRPLAAALGTPLSEPELEEAAMALDTDGNGRIDFEEFASFWLSDEAGIDPAIIAAAAEIRRDVAAQKRREAALAAVRASEGAGVRGVGGSDGGGGGEGGAGEGVASRGLTAPSTPLPSPSEGVTEVTDYA